MTYVSGARAPTQPGSIYIGVSAKPGLWTLDWTHGLDCGLRFGLDFGLMRRAMTTISKRLWKEGTVLQLQARLVVTSSLVRTFPGPSGYDVKSQGASLVATCKHVEVAKSVSPAGMASPH